MSLFYFIIWVGYPYPPILGSDNLLKLKLLHWRKYRSVNFQRERIKEWLIKGAKNRKLKKIFFAGVSGCFYPFTLYPIETDLPDSGAVYIFIRARKGSYEPLYIGQTGALKSTISVHTKWSCMKRLFMNALCVHFEKDAADREQIVSDLIEKQCPPCNN